jgi:hypothetical protein
MSQQHFGGDPCQVQNFTGVNVANSYDQFLIEQRRLDRAVRSMELAFPFGGRHFKRVGAKATVEFGHFLFVKDPNGSQTTTIPEFK